MVNTGLDKLLLGYLYITMIFCKNMWITAKKDYDHQKLDFFAEL